MTFRLRPGDITPITASPFMTTHAARVAAPLRDVIASPETFMPVRSNLRAGDRVQLVRYEHGEWTKARVVEFCEVIITQSRADAVEFVLSYPIITVDEAKAATAAAEFGAVLSIVDADGGGFNVVDASGFVHKHFPKRLAAERYVADYGKPAASAA